MLARLAKSSDQFRETARHLNTQLSKTLTKLPTVLSSSSSNLPSIPSARKPIDDVISASNHVKILAQSDDLPIKGILDAVSDSTAMTGERLRKFKNKIITQNSRLFQNNENKCYFKLFSLFGLLSLAANPLHFIAGFATGGIVAGARQCLGKLKPSIPSKNYSICLNITLSSMSMSDKVFTSLGSRVTHLAKFAPYIRLISVTSSFFHGAALGHALVNYRW